MITDLASLDATLLLFDPDNQIEAIKPKAAHPPVDRARRCEMTRLEGVPDQTTD